jgi:hypothetical protein
MLKALTHGIILLAAAGLLCGCPHNGNGNGGEDDGGIQYGGKRPSPRPVTLQLKLSPGDSYAVVSARALGYSLLSGEFGADGEEPTMRSAQTVNATESLHRNVACSSGDAGRLKLAARFDSFNSDELSQDNEGETRRVLTLDASGLKLTLNDEEATPEAADLAMDTALRREFTWLVDQRSGCERTGEEWGALRQARSRPLFPCIDWERLTEQAMLLPVGETSAGTVEERTAVLPIAGGEMPMRLNWMLREVVGEAGAELAQITVQVNGMLEAPAEYSLTSEAVRYDGTVEHATVAGSYSMVFDAAAGRWRSIDSDLTANLTLRVAVGGKEPQVLAVELKNVHLRATHEFKYAGETDQPVAEDAAEPDSAAGEQ